MRASTAAILSVVLIGGMFVFPAVVLHIFLPSLKQNLHNPVPLYEMVLLRAAAFFMTWRFFIALPLPGVLFIIAAFTNAGTSRKN